MKDGINYIYNKNLKNKKNNYSRPNKCLKYPNSELLSVEGR